MKKIVGIFSVLASLGLSQIAIAQRIHPNNSGLIYQQLQQLKTVGSVMYIAAHPDDENTKLIAYLVNEKHLNTTYLSLTRGDGGQNILGNQQGAALGLIRTYEMMEARKIDGANQLFTRFIDFGFTKNPEETFKFWDKKQVIEDVKTAIQLQKPDILICRFPTTGEGGHGQHTASAIAALEAFNELQQDKNANTWKPKAIYFNAFRFQSMNTIKPGQLELITNQFNPVLGYSYGEIAGLSRSMHKSQGAGTAQTIGLTNENFELLSGKNKGSDIFQDIDFTWNRLGRKDIEKAVTELIAKYDFTKPSIAINDLLKIRSLISKVENEFWRTDKLQLIDKIIVNMSGIHAELLAKQPIVVANESLPLELNVIARNKDLKVKSIHWVDGNNQLINRTLPVDSTIIFTYKDYVVSDTLSNTTPYWLRYSANTNNYQYNVTAAPYLGAPINVNTWGATITFEINGNEIQSFVPLSYKVTDAVKGDVIREVIKTNLINIDLSEDIVFVDSTQNSNVVPFHLIAQKDVQNITAILSQNGKQIEAIEIPNLTAKVKSGFAFQLNTSQIKQILPNQALDIEIIQNGKKYNEVVHWIDFDHIPMIQYFTKAQIKPIFKTWNYSIQKVAYINGVGDKVGEVLSKLGIQVDYYNTTDVSVDILKKYQTVIVGVRAVNTQKDMPTFLDKAHQFVQNGGNLVFQYNTNQGLSEINIGVDKIQLSRNRVTDETASVTILNPSHPLLNTPNKIQAKDFDNWIQERGLYFPMENSSFENIIAMNDPKESKLNTAIMYKNVGKGKIIYTSLAFFRQLPVGNEGAIKLFLNMIN